jgi:serine/threonine protein kinase
VAGEKYPQGMGSATNDLAPGFMVTASIRLSRLLGEGGMGSIWVADHLGLHMQVVVKFISTEYCHHPEIVARFEREAAIAAQAKSPHVVQVLDHGKTTNDQLYIAMELLEGEDLGARLARDITVEPELFADWLSQAAKGLSRAHAKGIVHRDIKPENIFLCDVDGEIVVKLLDFGIAKSEAGQFAQTAPGDVLGTALFLSPEQAMGRPVDFKSDLWALAVVTYFALTGVRPFDGHALGPLILALSSGVIPPPSSYRRTLGPGIDAWMARALTRAPEGRFASAREMAEAFTAAVSGAPSLAPRMSTPVGGVPSVPRSSESMRVTRVDSGTMPVVRSRFGSIVRPSGPIDENFRHNQMLKSLSAGPVVFDMREVPRITSYGVREWLALISRLPTSVYAFVHCRPGIVSQFNIVANFGGGGSLVTLYAPYLCGSCQAEHEALIDLRTHARPVAENIALTLPCPSCGAPSDFDDVPDAYFAFVDGVVLPTLPPSLTALIDNPDRDQGTFRVEKRVEGNRTTLLMTGPLDERASLKRLADGLEPPLVAVLEGVTRVTDVGLRRFDQFSKELSDTLVLTRVPPAVLFALLKDNKLPAQTTLSTLLVDAVCSTCGPLDAEVEVGPAGQPLMVICPTCQARFPAPIEDSLLTVLNHIQRTRSPLAESLISGGRDSLPPGADATMFQAEGTSVFGRYELLGTLTTTAVAEVHLARVKGAKQDEQLVLTIAHPRWCEQPGFSDTFLAEARASAKLAHPNIARVRDYGVVDGRCFVATDYMPGRDLHSILRSAREFHTEVPIGLACRIASDVCGALRAAHGQLDEQGRPIVHGDISPRSIIVSNAGLTCVSDFGISRAAFGALLESPGYVPRDGDHVCDPRSDVFAVGAVLHECLGGEPLFGGPTKTSVQAATLASPIPPLTRGRGTPIPPELQAIVSRALARDPAARYASAALMQQDLETFLAKHKLAARPTDLAAWLASLAQSISAQGSGS